LLLLSLQLNSSIANFAAGMIPQLLLLLLSKMQRRG
jgi:hypothetical protein